jgi:hypothetical protein
MGAPLGYQLWRGGTMASMPGICECSEAIRRVG